MGGIVDNSPSTARCVKKGSKFGGITYMSGFPVGFNRRGLLHIHNQVTVDLKYFAGSSVFEGYRIVGSEVEPYSMLQYDASDGTVYCTYDVDWTESSLHRASRWDNCLKTAGGRIQYFFILKSLMHMLLWSGVVALSLLRALRRDITKYSELAPAVGAIAPECNLLHRAVHDQLL